MQRLRDNLTASRTDRPRARRGPASSRCIAPVLLLSLSGCAVFAGRGDYADYRAVRLAKGQDAQLRAMQQYVAHHPDGHWAAEIQQQRLARERAVFEAGKSDRAGLELYLAAFPQGVFVEQAQARLSAIATIEQRKQDEAERAARLSEQRHQRDAELSRTWVTRFIGYWTKTLVGLSRWGAPIERVAQGNPDFSRAFGRPPRPRCTADECVKYYESSFAVPVPGATRIEREMRLLLRLRMHDSRLVRAELLLPRRGFSRWKEIEAREAVVDGDAAARARAIEFALARLAPLLDQLAPGHQALRGFVLRPIPAPAIDSTGERVDTTVEDPSAPPNQIQGSAAADGQGSIAGLVKPVQPEQAPDMVMAPIGVGQDGRAHAAAEPDVGGKGAVPEPESGGVMELAPVVVPRNGTPHPGGSSGSAPAATAATGAAGAPALDPSERDPGVVRAFQAGGLRIVFFAAASDAPAPAYDGIIVEQIAPSPAH